MLLVPCQVKLAIVTDENADILGVRPYITSWLNINKPKCSVVGENLQYFGCIMHIGFNANFLE